MTVSPGLALETALAMAAESLPSTVMVLAERIGESKRTAPRATRGDRFRMSCIPEDRGGGSCDAKELDIFLDQNEEPRLVRIVFAKERKANLGGSSS